MATVPLETAINAASEIQIIAAGAKRLGNSEKTWPFLPDTSQIIEGNASNVINSLFGNSVSAREAEELADYLALSTFCHLFAGWRYLSQSALSFLSGARNEALHLAYYAELRAAFSILAGSGVGIFNEKNFSLNDTGNVSWFHGRTHEITWDALLRWAEKDSNAIKVLESFEPFGYNATEWATAIMPGFTHTYVAVNWLRNWAIDLRSLKRDKWYRDQASYEPDLRQKAFIPLDINELEFILDASSACNLINGNGSVDDAIILSLYESARRQRFRSTDPRSHQKLRDEIRHWLIERERVTEEDARYILETLRTISNTSGGKILLKSARRNKELDGVFSRALLLLRLASALNRKQWLEMLGSTDSPTVQSWQNLALSDYGIQTLLWDKADPPASYDVLETDQMDLQDEINDWRQGENTFNPFSVWKQKAGALCQLCRFERVGILAAVL